VNRAKGTLKIEVGITNADEFLLPDMSVRIQFMAGEHPAEPGGTPLVLAPKNAVRTDASGSYAWVVTDGKLRRQSVRAGADRGDQVIVEEGLSGGEALVVGDGSGLSEGKRVKTAR